MLSPSRVSVMPLFLQEGSDDPFNNLYVCTGNVSRKKTVIGGLDSGEDKEVISIDIYF